MKRLLTQLNARERYFLGIGMLLGAIYLFYAFVYAPLNEAVTFKKAQLVEKEETLSWMEHVEQPSQSQSTIKEISQANLLVLMNKELSQDAFKTFTYQLQQTNIGDVQLSFEKVPFNLFLSWLWKLSGKNAIHLKQMQIEHTEKAGVVKMNVVIGSK